MSLAKDVELMLRPLDSSVLLSRFRYSPYAGLPSFDSGIGQRSLGNTVSKTVGNSGPASVQVGYRDRAVRSLSRTEWEERRKKGLCYKCGQLYGPTHKCPEGKLRVLLLGDDESKGLEGLHCQLEHMDHFHSDGFSPTARGSSIKP
ncbi:hypothetical protein HanIR_Chr17g0901181 [Helianthus annuus]|nr:hypothetical protein HanIR_Chr17g0901181 [Helianthus annuus]